MKKIFSAMLATIMLLCSITSCTSDSGAGTGSGSGNNEHGGTDMEEPEEITIEGKKYVLTFCDEFDGKKLDNKKWEYCPEWVRADEGAKWNSSAVKLDGNGNLLLYAMTDDNGAPISGAIRSKGKFSQCKGYFECKAKFQSVKGFWGAFWLMCPEEGNVGNGDTDGAEIDIFESFSAEKFGINCAIHWDGYEKDHRSIGHAVYDPEFYRGYHTYSLLWDDEGYIFYFDGEEVWRSREGDKDYPGSCGVPTYLKLTAEIGTWAGVYDPAELPDCLAIDYVRVYREA